MNRIEERFKDLQNNKEKAFIVFLTCGYPDLETTERFILEFSKIGVDLIELGIPFSDPLADGKIIQESSQVALRNNIDTLKVFELVKRIRDSTSIPLCLMTYYNPVFCFGLENFMKTSNRCGVDGLIIPDLPVEESKDILKISNRYDLSIIFFISPTTTLKRIKLISKLSKGFIYYVSVTGVTGVREKLPSDLMRRIQRIKEITDKPICVGFGISKPSQLNQIYKVADGVIVGSAIIKKIKENLKRTDLVRRVVDYVSWLKGC